MTLTLPRCQQMLLVALSLSLLACAGRTPDFTVADELAAKARDTAVHCDAPLNRCAIDSPLHHLDLPSNRHHLMLLEQGEASLVTRVHMIRAAREQILLQNYVINDDEVSRFLLDELVDAARRGVQVRILADAFISMPDTTLQAAIEKAHSNLELRLYNPMRDAAAMNNSQFFTAMFCCFRQLNHRMHNKVFSIDGEHAILGGRNTAGRYFDMDTRMNYLDVEVLVSGSEVTAIDASFFEYWEHGLVRPARHTRDVAASLHDSQAREVIYEGNSRHQYIIDQAEDPKWLPGQWETRGFLVDSVQYFSDPPGKALLSEPDPLRDSTQLLHNLMETAEHRVVIQSPYLVMSRRFEDVLRNLNGIEILFSSNSLGSTDAFPVYAISRRQRQRMLDDYAMRVFEMKPFPGQVELFVPRYPTLIEEKEAGIETPMLREPRSPTREMPGPRLSLHGKILIVDDHTAVVTAHNFDPRSEVYNTENGIIVHDTAFAAALNDFIELTIAPENSWESGMRESRIGVLGAINRRMAGLSRRLPTLDLWPTHATENFNQPDPEDNPLPRADRAVGEYPEVRLGRRMATSFISRMMGFTRPLM